MHSARNGFRVISANDEIEFKANGGSITNRGGATATIDGVIEIKPGESYNIPVVSPLVQYNQMITIQFADSGNKKLVVQQIKISPSLNTLEAEAGQKQWTEALASKC